MAHATMRAKVVRDNTGASTEIPVIVTEHGPLLPLVDYLLERVHTRSQIWMVKLTQAVGLLLDYTAANHSCYDNSKDLFVGFVQRLYTGTVDNYGNDPSGLYWQGRSPVVVRQLANLLSEFSDWMAENQGTKPINPWRQATRSEELLAWAAWHQKRDRAFLAHGWDREKASFSMTRARNALLKKTPLIDHDAVKSFTEDRINDLLFKGFIVPGKQRSPRVEERLNLRDILITLLMHYGGLRMSEPFHIFVHDVMPDPLRPELARVRVFHPSLGTAPPDWRGVQGKIVRSNRDVYLRGRWGMLPRTEYATTHQWHAGWKGNALDGREHCMEVHWFPTWAGELFMKLWLFYMAQRAHLHCDHPFAFVTREGKPYAIDSFERAHRRAIERIGMRPAKALGTTPHAHRHAYGRRLTDAKIDPIYRKKALHHKSLESQTVYTEPDRVTLNRLLESVTRTDGGDGRPAPPALFEYGFNDVDPLGLPSGPNPKLVKRS